MGNSWWQYQILCQNIVWTESKTSGHSIGNSRIGKQTLLNSKLNITKNIVWTLMPREDIRYLSHNLEKVFCRDDDIANMYQNNVKEACNLNHHSIRSISFQYLVVLYCNRKKFKYILQKYALKLKKK